MFFDIEAVLNQVKPPSPDLSVVWAHNHPRDLGMYMMLGCTFLTLPPEDIRDPARREAKIGSLYVNPEGRITFNDVVAMVIPTSKRTAYLNEVEQESLKRIRRVASPEVATTNVAPTTTFKMTQSATLPADAKPKDFGAASKKE